MLKILHITDLKNSNGNGVSVAVLNYLKFQSERSNVAIFNLNAEVKNDTVKCFNYTTHKKISDLTEPFNNPDIVIFNEVYKPKYIKLYKECLKNDIPYVVIPHGCLVNAAQKEKKIKKIVGNTLLFNSFIKNANAIQFLNEKEKNNTNFKYKEFIISGNGINVNEYGENNPTNNSLVYIGRYDMHVKGIDLLIDTCSENKEWFLENKICINLYGKNDDDNEVKKICDEINKRGVSNLIHVNGPIYNQEKRDVLNNAYAFIQLSRHEGQPMGIIEALSSGLPCVLTYGTSFGEFVNDNECGYACSFSKKDVFNNIKRICENKNTRDKMAINARNISIKKFDMSLITDELIKEYEDLCKRG